MNSPLNISWLQVDDGDSVTLIHYILSWHSRVVRLNRTNYPQIQPCFGSSSHNPYDIGSKMSLVVVTLCLSLSLPLILHPLTSSLPLFLFVTLPLLSSLPPSLLSFHLQMTRKKVEDISRKLEILYDLLRDSRLSPEIAQGLHSIARGQLAKTSRPSR